MEPPPHKAKPDLDYSGPLVVLNPPLGATVVSGMRLMHVKIREPLRHEFYELDKFPTKIISA